MTKRNFETLKHLCRKNNFNLHFFDKSDILLNSNNGFSFFNLLLNILNFNVLTFNNQIVKKIDLLIVSENVKVIFVDSTLFGLIIHKLVSKHSHLKVFYYSHNVELISYFHAFKISPSIKSFYNVLCSFFNEKASFKKRHCNIGISNFDNVYIEKYYSKKFDHIVPITLDANKSLNNKIEIIRNEDKLNLLFVGSYFYPNIQGVIWFLSNVFPHIDVNFTIIGKDMKKLKTYTNIPSNVEILENVNDLSEFYFNSDIIIAPIFYGSGMKVKVAEALKYGKIILGTRLSFQGYENIGIDSKICESPGDYITYINKLNSNKSKYIYFSSSSSIAFNNFYSSNLNEIYFQFLNNNLNKI